MSDEFCMIHGSMHMARVMGTPIPVCEVCDALVAKDAEIAELRAENEKLKRANEHLRFATRPISE